MDGRSGVRATNGTRLITEHSETRLTLLGISHETEGPRFEYIVEVARFATQIRTGEIHILEKTRNTKLEDQKMSKYLFPEFSNELNSALRSFSSISEDFFRNSDIQHIQSSLAAVQSALSAVEKTSSLASSLEVARASSHNDYAGKASRILSNVEENLEAFSAISQSSAARTLAENSQTIKTAAEILGVGSAAQVAAASMLGAESTARRAAAILGAAEAARAADIVQYAKTALGTDWNSTTKSLSLLDNREWEVAHRNAYNLASSYESLVGTMEDIANDHLLSPSAILARPTQEVYLHTSSVRICFDRDIETPVYEVDSECDEIETETEDVLTMLLKEEGNDFVEMWRGARLSLLSNNPDRLRHFSVSARALFENLLRKLAPTQEVKTWTNLAEHFSKDGKPTRKAKLLYCTRGINQKSFNRFVRNDVDSALHLYSLLSKGIHRDLDEMTSMELSLLRLRIENLIRFLLELPR